MDHTDFVGRIEIAPSLNEDEAAYLARFARSRTNGCAWTPCPDGCCLTYASRQGRESPAVWLRYVLAQFLGPAAGAARLGDERCAGFTFDHRLDGVVVGFRRGNGELFSISVANNRVHEKVLRPGRAARKPARRTSRKGAAVIDLAQRRASRR